MSYIPSNFQDAYKAYVQPSIDSATATGTHYLNTATTALNQYYKDVESSPYGQKIKHFVETHLTFESLTTKSKNAVIAKVNPLSNPAGYEKKIDAVRKREIICLAIKKSLEEQIKQVEAKIEHLQSQQHPENEPLLELETLKQELETLNKRLEKLNHGLEAKKKLIKHLETECTAKKVARGAGYAGSIANTVAPGSRLVVNLAITTLTTATQVGSAYSLEQNFTSTENEIKSVQNNAACTAACWSAGKLFSDYVWLPLQVMGKASIAAAQQKFNETFAP